MGDFYHFVISLFFRSTAKQALAAAFIHSSYIDRDLNATNEICPPEILRLLLSTKVATNRLVPARQLKA